MFQVCLKFNPLHRYTAREEHVHELAIGGSSAQLFDLREVRLQAIVHPRQHIMPRQIVRRYVRGIHVDRHIDFNSPKN